MGSDLAQRQQGISAFPLDVWNEFVRLCNARVGGTSILGHVGYSLRRVLIAFGLAIALGLPLGLLMAGIAYVKKS